MAAKPAAPAQLDLATRVVAAMMQGSVGAVVGATLSAVTEPVVNRILVKRLTLGEAIRTLDPNQIVSFFSTTVSTNFIKFPFFEVTNVIMQGQSDLPPQLRGAITGAIFCTLTLPITNYRYCKSMNLPVDPATLYKAYLPTVLRDIVYGMARTMMTNELLRRNPDLPKTTGGRFYLAFMAVMASCLASAPFNEVRGYYLQPKDKVLPVSEFFQPERFIRSTSVGALIMSTALGVGAVVSPVAQERFNALREWSRGNQTETIVLLFFIHQLLASSRASSLHDAVSARKSD